jgi:hypothetical protein
MDLRPARHALDEGRLDKEWLAALARHAPSVLTGPVSGKRCVRRCGFAFNDRQYSIEWRRDGKSS